MIDKKMYETRLLEWTLQRLFGETSYHVERSPCRGKFRGHNDYSIVFGSGRKLFIGQDQRNYLNGLRKQVGLIQHFRDHDTPFCDAAVEIVPYNGSTDLVVYGVVILTHQSGAQLLYRETAMHFYLVDGEKHGYSFDKCMAHLLKDACGERAYCKEFPLKTPPPEPEKRPPHRKGGPVR